METDSGGGGRRRRLSALFRMWQRRWRAPIGPLVMLLSGGLVLVSVATVLYLGYRGITTTTVDMGREKAALVANIVEARLKDSFDGVAAQTRLLADIAEKQGIAPPGGEAEGDAGGEGFIDLLAGALSANAGLTALDYFSPDGAWLRVTRSSETGIAVRRRQVSGADAATALARTLEQQQPSWGRIFWDESLKQPLLNYRLPVAGPDGRGGVLVAVIGVADLSLAFDDLYDRYGVVPFILLQRQFVLAHPNLARGFSAGGATHPLPTLDEVGDPVLAQIWEEGSLVDRLRSDRVFGGRGHLRHADGTTYVYLYREVQRPGADPWLVGSILREDSLDAALDRALNMALAGLAILILAVSAAGLAARRLSRRFHEFAGLAGLIRSLDFDDVPGLRRSRIREVDDTAQAMNQMADAMRWFVSYVPRGLVRRLVRMGSSHRLESENRVMTVMFTDITGFTALSEAMRADEVAAYLNRHFSMLEECVEAYDGTVDKMLGDGLMVFWGAPDAVPDHARRACAAALAIAEAVRADNARLSAEGLPPVRLRIGLHSGPVTVGNIGGTTRVNYTIVGDTVNTAQRICDFVRELTERAEITILLSEETRRAVGDEAGYGFAELAEVCLRGQKHATKIYRLTGRHGHDRLPAGDGPEAARTS